MDLGKAFRETEERFSINSVVTVCASRPGIKVVITQTCCGLKHHDQSAGSVGILSEHFTSVI